MNNFLTEFKKFITRGNVFELAIAVVIGGAFSRIVQSLVNDIVMPLLSLLVGRVPFAELKLVLTEANLSENRAEIAIYYGRFIQASIDFLIIALVIFISFKILQRGLAEASKISLKQKNKVKEK
jgi:large conductance mechanosensitive channel